jgi:prevent-host-death family protein
MQTVTSREVQNRYGEFIESVQDDMVCVTRHGRPLFWAVSDRHVRAADPSVLIGRMLLLHGQLNRAKTARAGDMLGQTLFDLDAAIDPKGLTEENVMTIVHGNRL